MKRSICLYILCFAVVAGAGYLFTGCGAAANPADELDAKTMPTENANDAAVDNGIPDNIMLRLKNAAPEDAGKVRQEIQKERLDAAQVELGENNGKTFCRVGNEGY